MAGWRECSRRRSCLARLAGRYWAAATAGFGLGAPFIIYGVALLIAAAVVFFSLRNSSLAAPAQQTEPTVTVRVALQQKAYRAALLSNFATGWSVFGLRMALVPLFVAEALDQGPGMAGLTLATFAIGNVSAVFPSGYLSDRVGRRKLLIIGLSVSAVATAVVGFSTSLPVFLAGAYVAGAASGMFSSPQQAAVADIIGSKARAGTAVATFQMMADLGSIIGSLVVGQVAQHTVVRLGVCGQRRRFCCWQRLAGRSRRKPGAGRRPSQRRPARWARRPAAKCRDQRF